MSFKAGEAETRGHSYRASSEREGRLVEFPPDAFDDGKRLVLSRIG